MRISAREWMELSPESSIDLGKRDNVDVGIYTWWAQDIEKADRVLKDLYDEGAVRIILVFPRIDSKAYGKGEFTMEIELPGEMERRTNLLLEVMKLRPDKANRINKPNVIRLVWDEESA